MSKVWLRGNLQSWVSTTPTTHDIQAMKRCYNIGIAPLGTNVSLVWFEEVICCLCAIKCTLHFQFLPDLDIPRHFEQLRGRCIELLLCCMLS